MKKYLIAGIVALTVALVGASVNAAFDRNLSVGSTGTDVSNLQTTLIAKGFDIPAITAGTAKGYFGQQTKLAVIAYQRSVNVPTTGFVGPLTRTALNSGSVAVTTGCPAGFTCTSNAVAVMCPAGFTCTSNTGGTTIGAGTNGTDGSVSVSQSSFVSSGQSIKKGETKNIVAVKLQATAGPVTVSRVDAHFSVRPWLFFSTVKLIDSAGKVLASKSVSGPADVTEITVGSDYLVRFEGLNYVVTPGTNPDLAVGVSVLGATDKITNGMSVTANISTGAIRTINGLGFTDSIGGAVVGSTSGVGASTFTLTSTGSVADISTKIAASAPATQVSQVVSATVSTNNVELGVFSLKSANNSSTVNSMNFTVQTNPNFTKTGLFSNVRMMIGSTSYGALSFDAAGLATFTNLNIALPQDIWTDIKLVADVAATSTNVLASSTLVASSISAIDSTYTTATIAGSSQTSANTLLTINSVALSAASAVSGTGIADVANGPIARYPVNYTFTLTNSSSNSLYISSDVSTLLGTTTSPTNASSTITAYFPTPSPVAGDVSGAYIIPTGSSRTFTVVGTIKKSSNASASESLSINRVTYGTTSAGTGATITTGLEKLSILSSF